MFPVADGSCFYGQLLETTCQSIRQLAAKQAENKTDYLAAEESKQS